MTLGNWEAVIGLEIHCQLATETKIFCACPARTAEGVSVADLQPNINTCPVCTGHPGALPVLNRKVVDYAILAGLAMNCRIRQRNVFARKNYFYPDSPKGYQLSQYELPICEDGHLEVEVRPGENKRVIIQRIHMEEDAGKSIHLSGFSVVNLNRAGVPLIEIVSGPDMRSAEEAGAYMRAVHAIVTHIGVTDGNMQEGNFRCDANVSVRPRGRKEFGTRVEIKNVNSFRYVEKAIDFEIARQISLIQGGGAVVQETRLYDADRGLTSSMRSKEEAMDYRYFPDPDLMAVQVDPTWIERVRKNLPELPAKRRDRYIAELGLSHADASALTASAALARFFEESLAELDALGLSPQAGAKPLANWITGELSRLANEAGVQPQSGKIRPRHLAGLVKLTVEQVISNTGAKQALSLAWGNGEAIETIVEREGLKQVSDTGALEAAIKKILAANAGQVAEYRSGKEKVFGFFVGQVMKEMKGKANPGLVNEFLKKMLSGDSQ
ncbi:MAG: Asp-tRNA(Asn)/Glu-tRNA(Gln) amidotransferase subunit GatB [Oligoflexia bacterium]|nr:Asp-tRNA(Asn)/Glu-tRNA(Gln) amidotransferase subunit GatB [Oligoflexia bacterium]